MSFETDIKLTFKNPAGEEKTLYTTLKSLYEKMPDEFYEELEGNCT